MLAEIHAAVAGRPGWQPYAGDGRIHDSGASVAPALDLLPARRFRAGHHENRDGWRAFATLTEAIAHAERGAPADPNC